MTGNYHSPAHVSLYVRMSPEDNVAKLNDIININDLNNLTSPWEDRGVGHVLETWVEERPRTWLDFTMLGDGLGGWVPCYWHRPCAIILDTPALRGTEVWEEAALRAPFAALGHLPHLSDALLWTCSKGAPAEALRVASSRLTDAQINELAQRAPMYALTRAIIPRLTRETRRAALRQWPLAATGSLDLLEEDEAAFVEAWRDSNGRGPATAPPGSRLEEARRITLAHLPG